MAMSIQSEQPMHANSIGINEILGNKYLHDICFQTNIAFPV